MDLKTINSDQLQTVEENSKVNKNLVECKEDEISTVLVEHKTPIAKKVSHKKLFCPPFMSRMDYNNPHFEYKIIWGCHICQKMILSKTAAINHANICKPSITKEEDISIEELNNMEKDMSFPCKYCSEVMTSKEVWIKHLNKHETADNNIDDWGDDLSDKSSDSNDEEM